MRGTTLNYSSLLFYFDLDTAASELDRCYFNFDQLLDSCSWTRLEPPWHKRKRNDRAKMEKTKNKK